MARTRREPKECKGLCGKMLMRYSPKHASGFCNDCARKRNVGRTAPSNRIRPNEDTPLDTRYLMLAYAILVEGEDHKARTERIKKNRKPKQWRKPREGDRRRKP